MVKYIKKFQDTGFCTLDVELLQKKWDYRFVIYQTNDEYRFVQFLRKGSSSIVLKCSLSSEHAIEIINKIGLIQTKGHLFKNSSTWRKPGFSELDMAK